MEVNMNTLNKYMHSINKFPVLDKEQEKKLINEWRNQKSKKAFDTLVNSNLRFVVSVANEYKGYNISLLDLIQSGNEGLLIATKKFDPNRDFKFISYAVWWIRACIQNYILKGWSLVKLGTTQEQRKLFYKLRGTQETIARLYGTNDNEKVAKELNVSEDIVINMDQRMNFRDFSLNSLTQENDSSPLTYIDVIPDESANQEESFGDSEISNDLRQKVEFIMKRLNSRERFIISKRIMSDTPITLKDVGEKFQISRERARQLELSAIEKIRTSLLYE